ncbi:DUF4258 domain-containing protein [Methylomonas albis]|uniref:DUF4258 domain-containing protein n=1 Tax=Methylomonas albis TaxID=1854563 RepID=A0ABR9D159_9GAMM|nr:DUF4258 domain-containing protein [Methylomonas albis]MBD9356864.1 DUF4258 domain-containing protein [Methylomonas albis]
MKLIYRKHAIIRMFERGITDQDIRSVLVGGEVIANYPNDTPYPSQLVLGWVNGNPIHVLSATAEQERQHFSVKLKWVPSDFSAKNLLAVYAFGGPDSSASPRFDPTGGRNIGSRMT